MLAIYYKINYYIKASFIPRKTLLMSYGSKKTKNTKTKRITSSNITNKKKKERLAEHFSFVKHHKNKIYLHIFNNKALL